MWTDKLKLEMQHSFQKSREVFVGLLSEYKQILNIHASHIKVGKGRVSNNSAVLRKSTHFITLSIRAFKVSESGQSSYQPVALDSSEF